MQATDFLQTFRPHGVLLLSAIHPTKGGITSFSFRDEPDEMGAWIEEQQAQGSNIYFSVNPVTRPLNKKAERGDIAAMEYLHVDLDLPSDTTPENIEEKRAELLALLTTNLPTGVPEPTWVIDSGGGYWGFWALERPVEINGKSDAFEDCKRYNQQLEILFGADACHNVDRIARVPGLLNFPNKKKIRQRGEDPRPTSVVAYHPERRYIIQDFTQAPLTQDSDLGFTGNTVKVSGNHNYTEDVDEAFAHLKLTDLLKTVIVQGNDPDDPARWPSRSEPQFWVACEMIRQGASDDDVYLALTNPNWGIAEGIREKGHKFEKYALRQIERARENAIDPLLMELNEKHAVIMNLDGKCRIMSETVNDMGREVIDYQTFDDFRNRYLNRKVTMAAGDKVREIPAGKFWTEHAQRRQYESVSFDPGGNREGYYNLWRGFACDAIPGSCDLFLEHVRENICDGNEDAYQYVLGWMAMAVQKPQDPGHVAIVLQGGRGTGKGEFVKKFGQLFGRHFLQVTDPKHIVGNFNAHLQDCVVLFADEAFSTGNKAHESALKTLITEESLMAEGKGVNVKAASNHLHILMASNEDWVVSAGSDERRYLVLKVGNGRRQDHAFFRDMDREYRNGGREALLHLLLNMDLTDFSVRTVPATDAMVKQKTYSLGPVAQWWYDRLMEGELIEGMDWANELPCPLAFFDLRRGAKWDNAMLRTKTTEFFQELYTDAAERSGVPGPRYRSSSPVVMPDGQTNQRPWVYYVPDLEEARRLFADKYLSQDYTWPSVETHDINDEEPF